jgi:hypothetical protein
MSRWKANDHWVISDISGQKHYRSDCRYTWDGLLVHRSEWYPKNPQQDVKGKDEEIAVRDSRPRQPDKFYTPTRDDL